MDLSRKQTLINNADKQLKVKNKCDFMKETFQELVHVHTQIAIITQNTDIIYAWNLLKLRRLTNPD